MCACVCECVFFYGLVGVIDFIVHLAVGGRELAIYLYISIYLFIYISRAAAAAATTTTIIIIVAK